MESVNMGNIPVVSINKSVKMLSSMYINYLNKGILENVPSVMLWGPPGCGKSQSVREIAKDIEKNTTKKVNITDVRLILFNPIDLRGIPTFNENRTLSVWLKPKIFDMDESDAIVNILFLDEISAAPQSVQAAAYQITLDRKVGEHTLPKNCIVIAAGNRVTDKSVAYQMPKALANRLLHFEIEANYESWNEWAVKSGINEKVLGFLKFKPDYLNKFDSKDLSLAFATPRSWEMVSNILNNVSGDISEVFDLIAGLVGTGVATEFKGWARVYTKLPDIKNIFKGTESYVPKDPSVIYALTSSMLVYAKKYKDDLEKIQNSIRYIDLLPPDFSFVALKDYLYIEGLKDNLFKIPEYNNWLRTKGRLLDVAKK